VGFCQICLNSTSATGVTNYGDDQNDNLWTIFQHFNQDNEISGAVNLVLIVCAGVTFLQNTSRKPIEETALV
jgi:hypothetical protein